MTSIFLLEMSDFTAFCRTISKNRKYWKIKKGCIGTQFFLSYRNYKPCTDTAFWILSFFRFFYMFTRKTLKFSAATAERTTIMVIVFLDFGTGRKCIDKTVIVLIHMYAVLF